jgi:hypothetical protein
MPLLSRQKTLLILQVWFTVKCGGSSIRDLIIALVEEFPCILESHFHYQHDKNFGALLGSWKLRKKREVGTASDCEKERVIIHTFISSVILDAS